MKWLEWFRRPARRGPLDEWRQAWHTAKAEPLRAQVRELRRRLEELPLPEDDREVEQEMQDGLEALAELSTAVERQGLTPITTGHRASGTDVCYFTAPASLPDEPGHPSGTLLLTAHRAVFTGGSRAVQVRWHTVARVVEQERDLVLVRHDAGLHRFRCNSYRDVLLAAFLARALSNRRV